MSSRKVSGLAANKLAIYRRAYGCPRLCSSTFRVIYNGNSNTSGNVPADGSSPYKTGSTVTILGNSGSLAKAGYSFIGWNTVADGSGTSYVQGNTFRINANTTLYAQWTPANPPGAPTNLSAIPGDGTIQITFTAPSDGGSPITNYQYSLNEGTSWTSFSSSPVIIDDLINGTVYNITLRAVNVVGSGPSSSQIDIAPIPGSFVPSNISGLNLWLDGQYPSSVVSSGNIVSVWNDQSGAGNHFASSPTGTINYSQPSGINNRPAINFVTSSPSISTYLSRSFNIAPTNQLSLFMVVNHVSTGTGNSELFFTRTYTGYINGSQPFPYEYFDLFSNTQSTGQLSLNIGNQTQVTTGEDIRGTIALIDVIATTSTANVYVNGERNPNNDISRGPLSLNREFSWTISGAAFRGYVGEVIAYPSGLSDNDRQKVEGYLAWKWGLQANLPNNHPYRNAPPVSLAAPVITSITCTSQTLSVAFTQDATGVTITNYQYSTDNGATFRDFSPLDVVSPLTITTLSSDGTTLLTNGQSYDVLIQAKTADGLGSVSNMVQVIPNSVNTVIIFPTVGSTTWTVPAGVTSVDYLVVGGGGGSGGGYDTGGGGGGGGGMVREATLSSLTAGTVYNVTVGDGGAGGISDRDVPSPNTETNGSSGQSSVFASIESLGGGRGYASRMPNPLSDPLPVPNPIASAGGISASGTSTASTGGSGGGSAGDGNGAGGGGGGSDSNGSNGVSNTGGNGGNGFQSTISGSSVTYGIGGRGANGNVTISNAAVAGAPNTGNGARGGGATSSSENNGAKGGSGIVILRYT